MKNYLKEIPEELVEKGLSKVLFVRREVIHLKHILKILLDGDSYDLSSFINIYYKNLQKLHKITRSYNVPISKILSTKKDKFYDYLNLFEGLSPIVYVDKDLPFYFKFNLTLDYEVIEVNLQYIPYNPENLFNFIIAKEGKNLSSFWLRNFKTYYYKNKRIKNFSLYDKEI